VRRLLTWGIVGAVAYVAYRVAVSGRAGDLVAGMAKAAGIKECAGCKQRRQWANRRLPALLRASSQWKGPAGIA